MQMNIIKVNIMKSLILKKLVQEHLTDEARRLLINNYMHRNECK